MTWTDFFNLVKSLVDYPQPSTAQRSSMTWLLVASATIVSTNHLVHDKHQHFPYHILIPQVLVGLAIHLFRLVRQHGWTDLLQHVADGLTAVDLLSLKRLWRAIYQGFAVLTLFSSYQAFFHLPSLICLTMVLALAPIGSILLSNFALRPSKQRALRAALITACVFTILWNDYRLTPNGISITLLAIGSYIATHFANEMCSSYEDNPAHGRRDSDNEIAKVLGIALLPLIVCTIVAETPKSQGFDVTMAPVALIINAVVGGITLATGGLLFARLPSVEAAAPQESTPWKHALLLLPLVATGYTVTGRDTVLSAWQIVSFLAAHAIYASMVMDFDNLTFSMKSARSYAQLLALHGWQKISSHELEAQESEVELLRHNATRTEEHAEDIRESANTRIQVIWFAMRVIIVFLASLGWLSLLLSSVPEPPRFSGYYTALDHTSGYEPLSKYGLDVVVSYHDEPVEDLVQNLNSILSIPIISSRKTRVFLYAKASSTPTEDLQTIIASALPNSTTTFVSDLPNIGREGATYLTHMLNNWNDLGSQTLFMQAEVHNLWYMQARINQYYFPRTGFLSLSFLDNFCRSCETCRDHSPWGEDPAVFKDVYSLANNGSECGDLVLTYRGQFMASATRIRVNGRAVYENLLQRFTDAFEETREENPKWGYTLERLWGVVMKCPGGKRIGDRCPSLASGLIGAMGALDDCQCLDLDTP